MDEVLKDYRDHLVKADQKSQENFDKTLLTLSSGALGLSLLFVKDFVNKEHFQSPWYLLSSWVLLATSLATVLCGFFLSRFSLRKAMRQIDATTIHTQKPGGFVTYLVEILNVAGGLSFIAGVGCLIWFAFGNINVK